MLESILSAVHSLYDLPALIAWGGYTVLAAIVFAETGLFFGFFLPGDSLLITAGILASAGLLDIVILNLVLLPAAIIGDAVGYSIGKRFGPAFYERKDSLFFRKEHVLKAKEFYEKHGGITIILARFIPLVRTFAPVVAGIAGMKYRDFAAYNIVGALLWVSGLTLLGFFLGNTVPDIEKNILFVIAAVVALSMLPIAFKTAKEFLKKRA